jgi:hypothetical protein
MGYFSIQLVIPEEDTVSGFVSLNNYKYYTSETQKDLVRASRLFPESEIYLVVWVDGTIHQVTVRDDQTIRLAKEEMARERSKERTEEASK